ncbi:MAG: TonB-dependent receptor domain-containing protein [Luteimonas sp.]
MTSPRIAAVPGRARRALLAAAVSAAVLAGVPAIAPAQDAPAVPLRQVHDIDIPSGPLPQALARLSAQTRLQVLYTQQEPYGVVAPAVRGRYAATDALARLLAGSGFAWREVRPGTVTLVKADAAGGGEPIVTDTLSVGGQRLDAPTGAERDVRGYDDVYDLDISTAYIGRAEVERYKGKTPADLVTGVPGVFSGDARNSGALDLNIRGIQGPGRVPVTIDGTEQALTVWRGYNGASNRNYIDPFLIGGIQIHKGPSLTRNTYTGIGGAMVVDTLDVDDVLDPGQGFGGEFRAESSSNGVAPRLPSLHAGEDYRSVEGYPQDATAAFPYTDRTLVVAPDTGGGGYNVFGGEDYAWRLALGWRPTDRLDLLAAYAYRERGNYYSGEQDADYYSRERSSSADDYITNMARYWLPGNEVPNTSSQMESWLFKATWRPTDAQALQFGYRDTLSHHGEIMPSRIVESDERGGIQWPLSRVDAKAWNLEYKWQPQGNRWIDLYANVWRTDTLSDTYTAGGFPNYGYDAAPIIRNTALANATSTRNGVTLSNRIALHDTLDLTLGGSFQHEKLRSDDEVLPSDNWRMYPRAGRREEWQANFEFEWRPADFLTLTAGARYASYWAFDDFLAANEGNIRQAVTTGYNIEYQTRDVYRRSDAEIEAIQDAQLGNVLELLRQRAERLGWDQATLDAAIAQARSGIQVDREAVTVNSHQLPWEPDAAGNYTKAGNACLNGSLDGVDNIVGNICRASAVRTTIDATARKRKDRGWTPFFSATAHFSDYSRVYFRYGETLRYPSMFESTIAFSASLNPWDLKPEHAYNWELAYVHDLGHLLGPDTLADVKLAYYVNKTRDVIERDGNFKFDNIDKQTIRGIELQGRYDSGRFFTDLGVNYQLENEVCDESTAAILTTGSNGYVLGSDRIAPNCVEYGFVGGYLLTQSAPELSASWSLGGRFFDRRLELGTRLTYYRQYDNPDLEWFRRNSYQDCADTPADCTGRFVYTFNVPFSWGETTLVDAYASYQLRGNLSVELSGTNLTDRYYVDPATRSAMAAPGRTLKLSFTGRF